eukprot:Phypoly_transcript_13312.p1 GENE.Phypoly_transcript_13312~~Phypoly_transcript_13312.p1  ORF type:complete len:312 (-),score=8.39 Phypoly_transcript_13312:28-963(-)
MGMTLIQVEYQITGPMCCFSAVICGFAIITSYIFPQQRKFPNVVLIWACISDFVFALYIAMELLPGPVRYYFAERIPQNHKFCTFSMYSLWAMQESASMLSFLLAVTLYVSIVKKIDLEENRLYYYVFIVAFWIPTTLLPFFSFMEGPVRRAGVGFCDTTSKVGVGVRAGSWFILLSIQVVMLVQVFRVVYNVSNSVKTNSSKCGTMSNALFWLSMRCIGAQVHQIIVWFPTVLIEAIPLWNGVPSPSLIMLSGITPCCLFINGFIVLAGNKPLRTYINTHCCRFAFKMRPNSEFPFASFAKRGSINSSSM